MKTIRVKEIFVDGSENIVEVGVNDSGNGFWRNGHQITGTCDYHASTPKDIMKKLRKHLGFGESVKMVRGSAQGW